MRYLAITSCALLLSLTPGISTQQAGATETDQFTLPDKPLEDIGEEISARTLEILRDEIAKINEKIDASSSKNAQAGIEPFDESYLAEQIYERTGTGLPESTMEREIRYGDFQGRSIRFQPSYIESIYAWFFAPALVGFGFLQCPTVLLYGVELGTDKIGHIFQQGFEYLTRYIDARAKGADDAAAVDVAVKYGVLTEATFFGVLMDGVYSNGDLAGNYAGFKFYRNLLHEVKIGDQSFAPIVERDGIHWTLNPDRANTDLLKPYISEHLDEAYNPSKYVFNVELIRRHVRARCESWFHRVADFNEETYRAHLERVRTWFGEAYGWDLPEEDAATLLDCFKDTGTQHQDRGQGGSGAQGQQSRQHPRP